MCVTGLLFTGFIDFPSLYANRRNSTALPAMFSSLSLYVLTLVYVCVCYSQDYFQHGCGKNASIILSDFFLSAFVDF